MATLTCPALPAPDRVCLDFAVLCEDCRFITHSADGRCALCGSHATLQLACVLNRPEMGELYITGASSCGSEKGEGRG